MELAQQLADRFAAVWNETEPAARRAAIERLWAPGGVHYVRDLEARGPEALERRIASSNEKNVQGAGNYFRPRQARALRDVVTFEWEMVRRGSEEVLGTGLEFLVLDARGLIVADYQFIVS